MLLALDTSTTAVGAAVVHDGTVLAQVAHLDDRRHAELLAPAVAAVLREAGTPAAGLDAIAVGVGPGPFTGLRVGLVTARVLGHVHGLPVLGVCSLDALAAETARDGVAAGVVPEELLVATDARRREVYWARYHLDAGEALARPGSGWTRISGPEVTRPEDLPESGRQLTTVGRGPLVHPDHLADAGGPRDVSAGVLGLVAETLSRTGAPRPGAGLLPPDPLYLRRPDARPAAAPAGAVR